MKAYGPYLNGFGIASSYPGCRGLEPFVDNLRALLDECERQGVSEFPAVVSAQAVYRSMLDFAGGPTAIYIPFIGTDCERDIAEVKAAINKVTIVLQAIPGASTIVPRPDAVEPEAPYGIPGWVKVASFGVLGVVALAYLAPLLGLIPSLPRRRYASYRRHRRSRK